MSVRRNVWIRFIVLAACLLLLVGVAAAAMPLVKGWWQPKEGEASLSQGRSIQLVADRPNTFTLSPGVLQTLKVQTGTAEKAIHPRQLRLSGSLSFDFSYQVPVRSRFAGEVIHVGDIQALKGHPSTVPAESQAIRYGDKVKEGQLLAVVWSKELGEKKSEFIDALSQMLVDQQTLNGMELYKS